MLESRTNRDVTASEMTTSVTSDNPHLASHPAGFVEKVPTEPYVPAGKQSLVGMSRAALADALAGTALVYFLMNTGRPLDEGLREYLGVRQGRL